MSSRVEKKGVGVNPQSLFNYTEHLSVICIAMGIPLIFLDPHDEALAKRYYPELTTLLVSFEQMTPEYLITHYDVLFQSDMWDRRTFHEKFAFLETKHHKFLRNVYCPHGYSDKGFHLKKCAREDIALLYGQNMIDMMKHYQVFEQLCNYVIVGNMRYTYYKKHKAFFDAIAADEVMTKFAKKQPTILYAPTWMDVEESTTFFEAHEFLIGNLPDSYNLIIKLHPRLELDDAALYYHIIGRYENKPNVLFLSEFPLVYPLIFHSDIYLGDRSAIGYDCLPFNKPMFFLNKHRRDPRTDRDIYLFRCGTSIKPDGYPVLYKAIDVAFATDQQRFSAIRQEVYNYTFAPERPFDAIKDDIITAYNKPYEE